MVNVKLLIMQVDILKKKNGSEYLIFDSVDEKKEVLKIRRCLRSN